MYELYCCAKGAIKTKKNGYLVYLSARKLMLAKLKYYGVLWQASLQLVNCCKFLLLETHGFLLPREDHFSSPKQ